MIWYGTRGVLVLLLYVLSVYGASASWIEDSKHGIRTM